MTTNTNFQSGQLFTNRFAETVHFYELDHVIYYGARSDSRPKVWAARWVTVHIPTNERTDRPAIVVAERDLAGWRQLKAKCAGWYGDTCASCGTVNAHEAHDHEEL